MNIYAEAISGYLQKGSGRSWADCLLQFPYPWPGGEIRVGRRYYIDIHLPSRNWKLNRGFVSFDTSGFARRVVKGGLLVLTVQQRGADFNGILRVYSQGTAPFGTELEVGDWNACDALEAILLGSGIYGQVRATIPAASINKAGQTQFRLRMVDETTEPSGDNRLVFYGPDDALRRPVLMIDTGNVYDDVCLNVAEVLDAHKAELGVTAVHSDMPETAEVDHVYVGWTDGADDDRQHITVDVYWIGGHLGDPTGTSPSLDRAARQKADLLRRILRFDANGNGYCTKIEALAAEVATYPNAIAWTNDTLLQGCVLHVTYARPGGLDDDEYI